MHKAIGSWVSNEIGNSFIVAKDPACGGHQYIPLFCTEETSRKDRFCSVDLLIHDGSKVLVVVEIEESNVKPTQVCGKFFTSAFSKFYRHKKEDNKRISIEEPFLFIQIVDTKKLNKEKTSKIDQWKHLERSIKDFLKAAQSTIQYKLIFTCEAEIKKSDLITTVLKFITKRTL